MCSFQGLNPFPGLTQSRFPRAILNVARKSASKAQRHIKSVLNFSMEILSFEAKGAILITAEPLKKKKKITVICTVSKLPPEAWMQVFQYLSFKDRLSVLRTCKDWSSIVQDEKFLKTLGLSQIEALEISRYLTRSLISSRTLNHQIFRQKIWQYSTKLARRIGLHLVGFGAAFLFKKAMNRLPPVTQETVDEMNKINISEFGRPIHTIESVQATRGVFGCIPMVLSVLYTLYDVSKIFNAKSRRLIEIDIIQKVLCCPPKVAKDLVLQRIKGPGNNLVPITPYRLEGLSREQLKQGGYANPNLRRFVVIQERLHKIIEERQNDSCVKKVFRERIIFLNPIYRKMLKAMIKGSQT